MKICRKCSANARCEVPTRGVQEKCRAREILSFNVRRLRNQAGWTQEQLSDRAGIDRSYLARLEAQSINISVNVLFALAKSLDVEPEELFRSPREVHRDD
jgi:DNA-binding XRE family transcriptional regulator